MATRFERHVSGLLSYDAWIAFQEECSRLGISNSEGIRRAVEAWLSISAGQSDPLASLRSRMDRIEAVMELYRRAQRVHAQTGDVSCLEEARRLAEQLGVNVGDA